MTHHGKQTPLLIACCAALLAPAPAHAQPRPDTATPRVGMGADARQTNDEGVVPEGSFVVRQFGQMRRLSGGGWMFVFAPDENGMSLPPMILMPSGALQAMEQTIGPGGDRANFHVSGQVFLYEGRNYLLPTLATQADEAADALAREEAVRNGAEPAPVRPEAGDRLRGVDEPSVEDLIRRIEDATARSAPAQAPAQTAASSSEGLLSEGTMLAQRRARLVRSEQGGWRLAFDNDGRQEGDLDQPLELLPCRLLESMRRAQERGGDPVFIVSGRVFIYAGRNYLLPTMVVSAHPMGAGITAAQ